MTHELPRDDPIRTPDVPGDWRDGAPADTAAAMSTTAIARMTPEMVAIEHDTRDRIARTLVLALPPMALAVGGWLAWGGSPRWPDLVVLVICYVLTGLGVTVGYHRLVTHRSFRTTRGVRVCLAVLGSMAVEGPVLEWVATHRKHHRFTDRPGDPHSPHLDDAPGRRGALRGLAHAHLGWMLRGQDMPNPDRYAKALLRDRDLRFISRTFPVWVLAGLALPFLMGVALTGSLTGRLTGLLWGGAVRILLLHHVTFSINSLCHYFGRRPFSTGDESRNLAWLAPLALGEAWHNNHHAFPRSARHGLGRGQIDPSGWLISTLERWQLAWEVVHITPARQAQRPEHPSPSRTSRPTPHRVRSAIRPASPARTQTPTDLETPCLTRSVHAPRRASASPAGPPSS